MEILLNALVLFANFVLIPALAYGAQLALGALGVTLIYGILRFSNFAHGDMMAFGTMLTILVTWGLQALGHRHRPAADRAARAARRHPRRHRARAADRPLGLPLLPPAAQRAGIFVMASVGVMFVFNGLTRFVIGTDEQRFDDGERFLIRVGDFRELTGLDEGLAIRGLAGAHRRRDGRHRRGRCSGSCRRPAPARPCAPIPTTRIWRCCPASIPTGSCAITWIIAAALATIAGVLYGLDKSFRPFTYFQLLLPIFAAAIVGGIGQPLGAIAGGFVVAFSEVTLTYAYKGVLDYLCRLPSPRASCSCSAPTTSSRSPSSSSSSCC